MGRSRSSASGQNPLLSGLLTLLVVTGCGKPPAPSSLQAGFQWASGYQVLETGDSCPVVHGIQGGTWTMPTLRAYQSGNATLTVACGLTTQSGEPVGQAQGLLHPTGQGTDLADASGQVSIPVQHAPPRQLDPIVDLYGTRAELSCETVNSDPPLRHQVQVILVEG